MKGELSRIIQKCEQYWNEPGICDEEIHAALESIHREACEGLLWLSAPPDEWRENLFRAIDHTLKVAAQWDKDHDVLFGQRILGGDNTVQHALFNAVLKALSAEPRAGRDLEGHNADYWRGKEWPASKPSRAVPSEDEPK